MLDVQNLIQKWLSCKGDCYSIVNPLLQFQYLVIKTIPKNMIPYITMVLENTIPNSEF